MLSSYGENQLELLMSEKPLSLGERIMKARIKAGLTQAELARMLGVTRPAVGQWEKDKTSPSFEKLREIAKLTGVTPQSLFFDQEAVVADTSAVYQPSEVSRLEARVRAVPEISSVQAGAWTEVGYVEEDLAEAKHWPCPVECSEHTFALRVEGDSMAPTYPRGSIIFVDPEVPAISGKKVVAKLVNEDRATFKQYIEDGGQKMLKAMNPNWPEKYIPINGNCEIIGTVIFAGTEE